MASAAVKPGPRGTTTRSIPGGSSALLRRNASRMARLTTLRAAADRILFRPTEIPRRG